MAYARIALIALFSIVALFLLTKLMGRKQVGQLDFFDYITGITIGSIAAEMVTEEDPIGPLVAMVVYALVAVGLSWFMNKCPRSRKFLNGEPIVILSGGKLNRKHMARSHLDLSEFLTMCRGQGYFDLRDIAMAVYEFNGKLSILPVSDARPLTPKDVGYVPAPAGCGTEIIMDGQILEQNLRRAGRDIPWLEKQLKEGGYGEAKTIFLAVLYEETLCVFPDK